VKMVVWKNVLKPSKGSVDPGNTFPLIFKKIIFTYREIIFLFFTKRVCEGQSC
jgi:hypothetical protein